MERTPKHLRKHVLRANQASALTLSEARRSLCPLVQSLPRGGEVAISVRGRVRAYLVSAERLAELEEKASALDRLEPRRPRLQGTLAVRGDLERGSRWAALELEEAALQSARELLGD